MTPARRCSLVLLGVILLARPGFAQYAEIPWPLPSGARSFFGFNAQEPIRAATQIGRRLFIGGRFTDLGAPTGGAAVVDTLGVLRPEAFPVVGGEVSQVANDGIGGWFLAGTFTSVAGRPIAGFARVAPDRAVDERFRLVLNGAIRRFAVAHGRVYLIGDFTAVNGAARRGLAVVDATTGALTAWGAGFDAQGRSLTTIAVSSIGVYVAGRRGLYPYGDVIWGFDASNGRVLFEQDSNWVGTMAASSARVYVGGGGYQRPLWAIDPLTGLETAWQPDMQFVIQSGTYGDYTAIGSMLLDGGRLYFGGRFLSTTGRQNLTAVDATTGERVPWRPVALGIPIGLARVGPYVALIHSGGISGGALQVVDTNAGATIPFTPGVVGSISTVAAAPEGVVLGGGFSGGGSVPRSRLASVDLDTRTLEPWTSGMVFTDADEQVTEVATDGTWLIARAEGTYGQFPVRVAKIDPATGAVAAERTFQAGLGAMHVAGGEIVVGVSSMGVGTSLGVITVADWSYRALPATFTGDGGLSLAVDGNTIYVSGQFTAVNGQSRIGLAAFELTTGALLPWQPTVDARPAVVRAAAGRVWIGGVFTRVGGQRRRGLAELNAVTGAVLPWNPDVLGVSEGGFSSGGIRDLAIGPDGHLYAAVGSPFPFTSNAVTGRPTVGGQATGFTVAFSTATGQRLPWTPTRAGLLAVLPDCLVTFGGCLPRSPAPPTGLQVAQASGTTTLSWTLPASSARTGVRLEVSATEGLPPLLSLDLPAHQTSLTATVPPGHYAVRVRTLEGVVASTPTADVTFSAGPPVPGAPRDATVVTDGRRVTFRWQPPSTGTPQQYVLEGGTSEGRADLGALPLPGSATSVTFDGPVAMYWTRLVAVNGGVRSGPGRELLVETRPRQNCSALPPTGLTASVSGRVVTFSWTPGADGSDSPPTLIAGASPGASALYLEMPAYATTFSIAAPPGTYYVRLAGGCFAQSASNEVMVVVP
jgi:hypothetical protein